MSSVDINMAAELQVPRFSSCRGVSFEINRNNSSPPLPLPLDTADTNGAPGAHDGNNMADPAPHPSYYWRRLPTLAFSVNNLASSAKVGPYPLAAESAASSLRFFSATHSRVSSHFCDLDIEDEEAEYQDFNLSSACQRHHDIEDPVRVLSCGSTNILVENGATCNLCNEDYKQQLPPPPAKKVSAAKSTESRLSVILLDQGLFTVYKRLFALCLALNLLGLAAAVTGYFPYGQHRAALFSTGNILASVLCRSEAFLRCIFWLTVKLLGRWSWVPLPVKTAATSFLQSVGGVHSGCGVSSILWLIYSLFQTLSHRESSSDEIIGVAIAILGLLVISSLAAFPLVRHLHHNVFERFHRFAGWAALAMLWAFVMLTASYNPVDKSYDVRGSRLVKQQEFWFTLVITLSIIFPWLFVRRVPVKVSAPSNHASLIKFQGGIESGILGRISRSPLSEWHAFGIISDGKEEHMMLAGAVGDFTRGLVSNPPTHLWVRGLRFAGLPYLINMYKRVVVVATGSGICVFLSFMLQPCPADVYFIWVAKGIEQNFGDEIVRKIESYPAEKMIIHDTAVCGRPNVSEMTVEAVRRWGAEVVIVTSNPSGSRDVVNGCRAAGIPAFGPIWDS